MSGQSGSKKTIGAEKYNKIFFDGFRSSRPLGSNVYKRFSNRITIRQWSREVDKQSFGSWHFCHSDSRETLGYIAGVWVNCAGAIHRTRWISTWISIWKHGKHEFYVEIIILSYRWGRVKHMGHCRNGMERLGAEENDAKDRWKKMTTSHRPMSLGEHRWKVMWYVHTIGRNNHTHFSSLFSRPCNFAISAKWKFQRVLFSRLRRLWSIPAYIT